MGITKLMHMKECANVPHTHLRNAIDYVLNQEKTKNGELVGGNSGLACGEILYHFLETKKEYGKLSGRQGYHYVISFAKGETDEQTAYAIVQAFCEQYLGDAYDYVFAIHNDKQHMHGHIIFNSVSRTTGYKYHYKKGDWEKDIQPVTDRLCRQHGLKPLCFEEERVGVSYAAWASKQENGFHWKDIVRADIDFAVRKSDSYEAFKDTLIRMGYVLGREGVSKGRSYLSLRASGMKRAWRTTNLGEGYDLKSIRERIRFKKGADTYEELTEKMKVKAGALLQSAVLKGTRTYHRMYQAVNYYQLPNPYAVPAYRVRKDMQQLEKLLNECRYLKINHFVTIGQLTKRMQTVEEKLAVLCQERKTLYGIQHHLNAEQREAQIQYVLLQKQFQEAVESYNDRFEELEEQMQRYEQLYPKELLVLQSRMERCQAEISALRKEKRMLQHLMEEEKDRQLKPKQLL